MVMMKHVNMLRNIKEGYIRMLGICWVFTFAVLIGVYVGRHSLWVALTI